MKKIQVIFGKHKYGGKGTNKCQCSEAKRSKHKKKTKARYISFWLYFCSIISYAYCFNYDVRSVNYCVTVGYVGLLLFYLTYIFVNLNA